MRLELDILYWGENVLKNTLPTNIIKYFDDIIYWLQKRGIQFHSGSTNDCYYYSACLKQALRLMRDRLLLYTQVVQHTYDHEKNREEWAARDLDHKQQTVRQSDQSWS